MEIENTRNQREREADPSLNSTSERLLRAFLRRIERRHPALNDLGIDPDEVVLSTLSKKKPPSLDNQHFALLGFAVGPGEYSYGGTKLSLKDGELGVSVSLRLSFVGSVFTAKYSEQKNGILRRLEGHEHSSSVTL